MEVMNCIRSKGDGALRSTPEELEELFHRVADADRLVIHIHGGLVTAAKGLEGAARLSVTYRPAASSVFLVWESGLHETLRNNLDDIFSERIFRGLVARVLKWTVGKLTESAGLEGAERRAGDIETSLPADLDHRVELKRPERGKGEPYEELERPDGLTELDERERAAFEAELMDDIAFHAQVEAVVLGARPLEPDMERAPGGVTPVGTRMSASVVADMVGPTTEDVPRSVEVAVGALVWRAAKVLGRVVHRFVKGRDHGVYPTVVEEILNELYLDSVGKLVWKLMKDDTAQTFDVVDGDERAGATLLRRLGEMAAAGKRPRVSLVGHSTGAVYINNLLAAADRARLDPSHPLPADYQFGDVVFLAPACTFADFDVVLERHRSCFDEFRMFTMSDANESKDPLVAKWPGLYTRSLLYFISGVLEPGADGARAPDTPILGMDRFHGRDTQRRDPFAEDPVVKRVRDFVARDGRVAWSETNRDAPPGRRADSLSHGAFDDPGETIESVVHVLQHGWR